MVDSFVFHDVIKLAVQCHCIAKYQHILSLGIVLKYSSVCACNYSQLPGRYSAFNGILGEFCLFVTAGVVG